jgi:predicted O-linked N-acetylglucosamine transferase (SPINDLY family)
MQESLTMLLQQAIHAFHAQDFFLAEQLLHKYLTIEVRDFEATHLLAIVYASMGKHEIAIHYYKSALVLNSNDPLLLSNFASSLNFLGQNQEALEQFKRVIQITPDDPDLLYNLGNIYYDLKNFDEAIIHYDQAIKLNPEAYLVYQNYGKVLFDLKQYLDAIKHYDQALAINKELIECLVNKGAALNELKRYEEAITHYDKALSIKPDYAEAYCNKGVTLIELKRYEEAITHCDKALSLKPDIDWLLGNLLYSRIQICEWSEIESDTQTLIINIQKNKRIISPFTALALIDDPKVHKICAKIYVENRHPMNLTLGKISKRSKKDKLRIGYFSADFRNHAVSILMAELFELHNKERFEIFAFSFGPDDGSTLRLRLSQSFKQFIDVQSMSDKQIAELSRKLEIDIAVDLGGYTANNRMGIFSYRAAPIQVSYIGYLGTTGAQYIDYLIADRAIIPEGMEKYYTEKIAFLPNYQCNDRKRKISERIFTRQDLGLPESIFIFCCLNNNYKISPSIFDSWM